MDKNFIERTTGVSPTESQEEHLTTLAECIYYVLVSTKGIDNIFYCKFVNLIGYIRVTNIIEVYLHVPKKIT